MPSVPRRPGRPSAEHQAAVARRLELLRAELSGTPALRLVPAEDPAGPEGPAGPEDPASPGEPEDVGEPEPWWSSATRVPGLRVPDEPEARWVDRPAAVDRVGVAVPEPGRHAARRRQDLVAAVVPETLRGRVRIGPAQLSVLAVVVCLGLAVTAWTVVRSAPSAAEGELGPVGSGSSSGAATGAATGAAAGAAAGGSTGLGGSEVVGVPGAEPVAAAGAGSGAPAPAGGTAGGTAGGAGGVAPGGSVTVDVAGKVRRPGIAVLATGSRVVDAIEAAGGARPGVDLTPLNLARVLVDGEQVVVGVDAPPGVAASALAGAVPAGSGSSAGPGVLVDLNTATEAELDTLPDVGPVTAQSIIGWRAEHGGFTSVDELLEVDGIGEATLTKLAPHVTV